MHILRLLEDDSHEEGFPVMDDTFFNQCFSIIANAEDPEMQARSKNASLLHTYYIHYSPLKPDNHNEVGRIPGVMSQMLVVLAHQARLNFVVSTETTLSQRLTRWLHIQIKHGPAAHQMEIQGEDQ
jgi:hypothetical protein